MVFVALQLVPKRVTNPAVRAEPPWDSAATRRLAVAACFNCHSNETKVAWFERIAPLSWVIAGHVEDGRHELNFSEYDPSDHDGGEKIADP
ncbi:MAG TPA: heme-binding domain-containing protein, partial [Acidimicrobiia bacterium]|nr:heme-binding domain-containing protein [Acidimicrobiia bacterium]